MRRISVLLLVLVAVDASRALACGDKFVVFGQGVRFQRAYAAAHPASIVVYLKPGSGWNSPESRDRLLTVLRMVGHHPQAVSTVEELKAAMTERKFDIVLTEFGTLEPAAKTVAEAKVQAVVIPMAFDPSRTELEKLEQQNSCVVAVSKRSHELLTVINDVMTARVKGLTETCKRKRA